MSDPTTPKDSPFLIEMQRLHNNQVAAIRSGDVEAIDHAAHELTHLLRMNAAGRLAEYFQNRDRSDR